MSLIQPLSLAAILLLAFGISGCGRSSNSSEAPKGDVQQRSQADSQAGAEAHISSEGRNDEIEKFLLADSFCRDVLAPMSLKDFLAEYPTAAKDTEQSRADIRYAVYQESAFRYEFLDEQLFSIRYSLPKTQQSADEAVVEYEAVLGPPTSTLMPEGLHQLHATEFVRWDLPEHHFRINFAYFPSDIVEADLLLFGQFVHLKRAQEFLKRSNQPSRDSSRRSQLPSRGKTSAAQREIQDQIDDPKWGSVAATINRLCTGQISDEMIHRHILKTIQLAREGGFTPEFTLKVLQQGEDIAKRRRLSTVTVVTSCQQSLAFGTSAAGEDP